MDHTIRLIEQFLKRQSTGNRRSAPRFDASAIPGFKSINLVEGPKVKLINISRRGALIESHDRISPEPCISLEIDTAETAYILKGQVIHCCIHSRNNKGVYYQTAIAFDEDFNILPAGTDENHWIQSVVPGAE